MNENKIVFKEEVVAEEDVFKEEKELVVNILGGIMFRIRDELPNKEHKMYLTHINKHYYVYYGDPNISEYRCDLKDISALIFENIKNRKTTLYDQSVYSYLSNEEKLKTNELLSKIEKHLENEEITAEKLYKNLQRYIEQHFVHQDKNLNQEDINENEIVPKEEVVVEEDVLKEEVVVEEVNAKENLLKEEVNERENVLAWEIFDECIQNNVRILYLDKIDDFYELFVVNNRNEHISYGLWDFQTVIQDEVNKRLKSLNPLNKTNEETIKLLTKIQKYFNYRQLNIELYNNLHRYIHNKEEYEALNQELI